MSENLNSNNIENDDFNLNPEDSDYKDLIARLTEIKSIKRKQKKKEVRLVVVFLMKEVFYYDLFLSKYKNYLNIVFFNKAMVVFISLSLMIKSL